MCVNDDDSFDHLRNINVCSDWTFWNTNLKIFFKRSEFLINRKWINWIFHKIVMKNEKLFISTMLSWMDRSSNAENFVMGWDLVKLLEEIQSKCKSCMSEWLILKWRLRWSWELLLNCSVLYEFRANILCLASNL